MTVRIRIDAVEAIQFHRIMTAGRSEPLLLTCEKEDGATIDAVVKFAAGKECTASSLCAELIASQLAADLGLPTPTPMVVRWGKPFADSVIDEQARNIVRASTPPAFGSTFVTNGFTTWPSGDKVIGATLRQTALAVFFFDAMIGNGDRGGMKPNSLARGDSLRLIDHEMAFRDYLLIAKPAPPWALGGLNAMVTPGTHIFATQLAKNAAQLDFAPIKAAWVALSDHQIDAYEAALPPEWRGEKALVAFAIGRIKTCRDKIDDCVKECRRALNDGT